MWGSPSNRHRVNFMACKNGETLNPKTNTCESFEKRVERVMRDEFKRLEYPDYVDPFNLHAVVYLGTGQDGKWEIGRTHTFFAEHSVGVSAKEMSDFMFDSGNTSDEDIIEQFWKDFDESFMEKVL